MISLFDLDRTLITVNCSFYFGQHLYRTGFLPFSKMIRLLAEYSRCKFGFSSIRDLHYNVCDVFFQGKSLLELESHVKTFVEINFNSLLYHPAVKKLEEAKSLGHYTTIVSSAPDFLVKEFANHFKVDEWVSTTYNCDHNRITGISYLMEGEEKADYLRELASRLNMEVEQTVAYSDSIRDLPFLEAAGKAVVVNPDYKLRQLSRQNRWHLL